MRTVFIYVYGANNGKTNKTIRICRFKNWIFIDNGVVNRPFVAPTYSICNSPHSFNEVKQKWFQMDLKSMTAFNISYYQRPISCLICPVHWFAHCIQFIQQKYQKNEQNENEERKKTDERILFCRCLMANE